MCITATTWEVSSQFVLGSPARPLERALLFPMAIVPNAWGLWNMLHLALRPRLQLPLGVHGSLLVLLLMPAGVLSARTFDVFPIQWGLALPMLPIGMAVYYLAWKYLVGILERRGWDRRCLVPRKTRDRQRDRVGVDLDP